MINLSWQYWRLVNWWRNMRNPPVVVIDRSGWATDRPQVHVSVHGYNGMQSVYSWQADSVGEASATMYGKSLADITRLRLIDRRCKANEPQRRS